MMPLIRLMRFDKPIGTFLLLWPTLIALWIASAGRPTGLHLFIFVFGTITMRAAGCIMNDIADRNFDGHVTRTKARPLAAGEVTLSQALMLLALLLLMALGLVCLMNLQAFYYACVAVIVAAIYPLLKRVTHWPQAMLGIAFSLGIPIAFSAVLAQIPLVGWVLFSATVLLTIAYDTLYAVIDKPDDLNIGIKSTAILFGRYTQVIVASLQMLSLGLFLVLGPLMAARGPYYVGWLGAAGLLLWQHWQMRDQQPATCFKMFLQHQWVGLVLFIGVVLELSV